jgi:threonine/homoserine/homoserine lactone efflux protein
MEHLASWLLFCSVNIAATIWPGPAFALTIRNCIVYNRRAALLTTIGLGLGVGVIVVLLLCGLSVLLENSFIYNLVRYAGAAYLFYLGVKAILAQKKPAQDSEATTVEHKTISDREALQMGLFTNFLNVKGMIFLTAIYTQFITPATPLAMTIVYALTSVAIEIGWFALVAILLTDPRVKRRFLSFSHWIERVCGGLLIASAIRLALSKGLA